jgi:hypothetical protein
MGPFVWSHDKNALLIAERGVNFEAVVAAIEAGELLDVLAHPNPERYPGPGPIRSHPEGVSPQVPAIPPA